MTTTQSAEVGLTRLLQRIAQEVHEPDFYDVWLAKQSTTGISVRCRHFLRTPQMTQAVWDGIAKGDHDIATVEWCPTKGPVSGAVYVGYDDEAGGLVVRSLVDGVWSHEIVGIVGVIKPSEDRLRGVAHVACDDPDVVVAYVREVVERAYRDVELRG